MSCAEFMPALQRCTLFAGLAPDELAKVCGITQVRHAAGREPVFMEGEPAAGMFLVATGSVRIFKTGTDGREHDIRTVKTGGIFAEAAVFDGGTYPAYAETGEASDLLFIPRDRLLALLKNDPQISLKMMGTLSRRLRQMVGMIEDLSLKDVGARLAKYLLDASLHQRSARVTLQVSKTALAQRLGTVPETLSRTFKKMVKQKAITVDGRQVGILDAGALQKFSAGMKD